MLKSVLVVILIASLSLASPALAQSAQQPAAKPGGSRNVVSTLLLLGGTAMMVGAATFAKSQPETYKICQDLNQNFGLHESCSQYEGVNGGLMAGGAAAAGLGAILLATSNRKNLTGIQIAPHRVVVTKRFAF